MSNFNKVFLCVGVKSVNVLRFLLHMLQKWGKENACYISASMQQAQRKDRSVQMFKCHSSYQTLLS